MLHYIIQEKKNKWMQSDDCNKQQDPTKHIKLETLMQNDITVSENYQRLISATLSGVFEQAILRIFV
jgi:hypothetical protein